MNSAPRFSLFLLGALCVCALSCSPASAQTISIPRVSPAASLASSGQANVRLSAATTSPSPRYPSLAKFASGTGNDIYLAAGVLLPLIEDGRDKKDHSLRTADSLITATLLTEGLKRVFREKRPDNGQRNSFPSGHATAAFAVATMQASYHPKQAILWYTGAALISYSRVRLRRHYTQDVIAGAAIGFFTARFELKQRRGLILSPFISPRANGGGTGVSVSMNF